MNCGHSILVEGCRNCDIVRSGLTPCGEFFLGPGSAGLPVYEFKINARLVTERMERQ